MLYRIPVVELTRGSISRRYSYTVVVMQYYPRFVPKPLVDEYLKSLAPDRELFTEFKKRDRELKDHNQAFLDVDYQSRFWISTEGSVHLERLSHLGQKQDVFLICQCQSLEFCHADLLLLLARSRFNAYTQQPRVAYPLYSARLDSDASVIR